MASRRLSNGRSPLVNQQRQITSFFSKPPSSSASPSPSTITPIRNPGKLDSIHNPNPNPSKASRGASPSPSTPSPGQSKLKKSLLVIGGGGGSAAAVSLSPASEKKRLVGEEVVGQRVKVYWPLDKSWYEGVVRSFDEGSGKHLVQYDDAEEESLHLAEEKIEWIEQSGPAATKFKRLRRGSAPSVAKMVIEDDEADNLEDEDDDEENVNGGDDSSDEDWGKSSEKKAVEKCEDEDEDMEMEDDEDEERGSARSRGKRDGKGSSKKRNIGGGEELGCDKKAKSSEIKVSALECKSNAESK